MGIGISRANYTGELNELFHHNKPEVGNLYCVKCETKHNLEEQRNENKYCGQFTSISNKEVVDDNYNKVELIDQIDTDDEEEEEDYYSLCDDDLIDEIDNDNDYIEYRIDSDEEDDYNEYSLYSDNALYSDPTVNVIALNDEKYNPCGDDNLPADTQDRVLILKEDKNINSITKYENQKLKKCNYYNTGRCKFGDQCQYEHVASICLSSAQNQVCQTKSCQYRHPKHCKYWMRDPEGCKSGEKCQFLHESNTKYSIKDCTQENNQLNIMKCKKCFFRSESIKEIREHRKTEHPKQCKYWMMDPEGCKMDEKCQYLHESNTKYNIKDGTQENNQWNIMKCKKCSFRSESTKDISEHKKTEHPKQCKYWMTDPEGCKMDEKCQYLHESNTKYNIKDCTQENNQWKIMKCKKCPFMSESVKDICEHKKTEHPKQCKYWMTDPEGCKTDEKCQYLHESNTKYKVKDGAQENNQLNIIKCKKCSFRSESIKEIREHRKTEHPKHCKYWMTDEEGCQMDEKCQYLHESNTKYSIKNCTQENNQWNIMKCKKCSFRSESTKDISEHKKTEHRKHCKYWMTAEEGCQMDEKCQYLHESNTKYKVKDGTQENNQWKIMKCKKCSAQNQVCQTKSCQYRRPKHCKYWMRDPKGCKMDEKCQYLHESNTKYTIKDGAQKNNQWNILKCNKCSFRSESTEGIREHKKSEHPIKYFNCDMCEFGSQHENPMKKHAIQFHTITISNSNPLIRSLHYDEPPNQCNSEQLEYKHDLVDFQEDDKEQEQTPSPTSVPQQEINKQEFQEATPPPTKQQKDHPPQQKQQIYQHPPPPQKQHKSVKFNCSLKLNCNVKIQSFSYKDELDLHMEFYHGIKVKLIGGGRQDNQEIFFSDESEDEYVVEGDDETEPEEDDDQLEDLITLVQRNKAKQRIK